MCYYYLTICNPTRCFAMEYQVTSYMSGKSKETNEARPEEQITGFENSCEHEKPQSSDTKVNSMGAKSAMG